MNIRVSCRARDREFPFGTMQHGVIRRITHATLVVDVVARIACACGMAVTFGGVIPITAIFLLLVAVRSLGLKSVCLDFVACVSLDV